MTDMQATSAARIKSKRVVRNLRTGSAGAPRRFAPVRFAFRFASSEFVVTDSVVIVVRRGPLGEELTDSLSLAILCQIERPLFDFERRGRADAQGGENRGV